MSRCLPLVEQLFHLIEQESSISEISRLAGLDKSGMIRWKTHTRDPHLGGFLSALNALGYDLKVVPLKPPGMEKEDLILSSSMIP
jgi:DNA-binding phage protein